MNLKSVNRIINQTYQKIFQAFILDYISEYIYAYFLYGLNEIESLNSTGYLKNHLELFIHHLQFLLPSLINQCKRHVLCNFYCLYFFIT